ncbi:glycosyltransferase [Cellulomonas pakistanensis]|uniref:4,4'-diaponeurosporenoate glycosyltransferase n=1 Tax=Cellulomonas pakistanensis TaxID=992287 RepID=A0A919P9R4_9CELL|nr:glycosyltransferase [Cellulomonas pakistanensis]GIG34702.1 glycosyl transferase [Cellulomonas pakistanensis]
MTARRPIERVLVVVPVHDEEELLAGCLTSVGVAAAAAGVPVDVLVALDDCRDGSAAVARAAGVRTVAVRAGAVGAARAAGITAGLARHADDPRALWLACTDADTVVPAHWLRGHRALADGGADVVVGTVRPDPRDLTPRQLAAWRATRVPGRPNGHVHGANLGVRADAYLRAGGFAGLVEHEDVDLVARLRADPAVVVRASDEVDVVTSGRLVGRTPGGYAGYLREAFPA